MIVRFSIPRFNRLSVPLFIGSSVYLFLCFSVPLFIGFSVSLFLCLSVSLFIGFSVYRFLCLSVSLFIGFSVSLFLGSSVLQFNRLSVLLFNPKSQEPKFVSRSTAIGRRNSFNDSTIYQIHTISPFCWSWYGLGIVLVWNEW